MKAVVPDREWQEAVVIIDMPIIHFVVHAFFYLNSSISSSWAGNKTFLSLLMCEELVFDMNTL